MKKQRSIRTLKRILTKEFNAFIRSRDKDKGCISCGRPFRLGEVYHASHYFPRSTTYASLAFDEKNVNAQHTHENVWLEGDKENYRNGLIKRYGQGVIRYLEIKKALKSHWTWFEYEALIKYYRDKNRQE